MDWVKSGSDRQFFFVYFFNFLLLLFSKIGVPLIKKNQDTDPI